MSDHTLSGNPGPKLKFISTFPDIPSWNLMFMLEAMTFKAEVCLEYPEDHPANEHNAKQRNPDATGGELSMSAGSDLIVETWTNLYHRHNPEGVWHAVALELIPVSENEAPFGSSSKRVLFRFGKSFILTSDGEFRFTFRAKLASTACSDAWTWAGGWMQDGEVRVSPPKAESWSQGPQADHILGSAYLGNFIAASVADKLGLEAVLNVADNLDLVPSEFSKPILYKKVAMTDGAGNPIPDSKILEAVEWLKVQTLAGRKTLVNCRAGIGRAGSTMVAFVFASCPEMTYEQAYNYVFERRFVYMHRGLKETVHQLFRK